MAYIIDAYRVLASLAGFFSYSTFFHILLGHLFFEALLLLQLFVALHCIFDLYCALVPVSFFSPWLVYDYRDEQGAIVTTLQTLHPRWIANIEIFVFIKNVFVGFH